MTEKELREKISDALEGLYEVTTGTWIKNRDFALEQILALFPKPKEEQEFNDSIDEFLLSDKTFLELPFKGIIETHIKLDNYGLIVNESLNVISWENGDNNYTHYTFVDWKFLLISDYMNGKMYLNKHRDETA